MAKSTSVRGREYYSFGKPRSITYPVVGGARYGIQFAYAPLSGELQSITSADNALLWQADSRNPERNLLHETFGDGATTTRGYETERGYLKSISSANASQNFQNLGFAYDAAGFMSSRENFIDGEEETFTHDELGRLTNWHGGVGGWAVNYQYEDIGNLHVRTSTRPGSSAEVKTFNSGGSAGPHAVTSVTTPGAPGEAYVYDSAGRQRSGPDRVVTYTDFDLPRSITKAGATSWFKYDANHRRAVKQSPAGTTFYLGSLYELRTSPGQPATHVMYIPGESGVIAQATQVEGSAAPTVEYLHADHQGSVNAVTAGSDVTQMRFDPFGARIGTSNPPMSILPPVSPVADVTRGFTGHEQDDELGLINMDGRIYDPALSRFLTPDPVISRPWKSQALNRYSYADNSPLKFTDPSGFDETDTQDAGKGSPPKGQSAHGNKGTAPASPDTTGRRIGGDHNGYISKEQGTHGISIAPPGSTPDSKPGQLPPIGGQAPETSVRVPTVTVGDDPNAGQSSSAPQGLQGSGLTQTDVHPPLQPSPPDRRCDGSSCHGLAERWEKWEKSKSGSQQKDSGKPQGLQQSRVATGAARATARAPSQIHHIATDKAIKSGFTKQFEKLFKKAGMTLQDALNKISVPGHTGPHSPLYHQYILDSLQSATDGLSGLAFRQALQKELIELGREVVSNPAILDGMGLE